MGTAIENKESKNIKIGVILSLFSFVISMVVNVVFIRFINDPDVAGPSQYGLYTFSTSMTSLLLALSFGMNSSYIRFATIAKKENGEEGLKKINGSFALLFIISATIAMILGIGIILFFHFGLIGSNYDASKRLIIVSCLIVSVANVVVCLLANIFTLYTNYNMRFIWARSLTITTSILTPLITSIIIYFNHNIVTYVCVELSINALALLVNLFYCVKSLRYRFKISLKKADFHILKNILVFSFFIFLVTIVTELTASTPKIILGLFPNSSGDNEISVAYYQLSATFIGAIAVASSAVSSTYIPVVNRYVAYGNNDDINRIFLKSTKIMIVAYALVMGGFISCGKEFVVLWQGNYYENTNLIYYLACALSLISFVPSTFGISSEIQRAKNKHHFRSFVLIGGFLINFIVCLTILLILPKFVDAADPNYFVYQVIACAIGFGIGNIMNAIVMSIYNQKVIKLNMIGYYKAILFNLVLVLASVGIVYFGFKFLPIKLGLIVEMILKGVLFILVFVLLLFLFDRDFVKSLFKRTETEVINEKTIFISRNNINSKKQIFVFEDFSEILSEHLKNHCYDSLFDIDLMKNLKRLHESIGFRCILPITKDIDLRRVPKAAIKEIGDNSDWLSVAFSSGKHFPYLFVDAPFIGKDFALFVNKFKKYNAVIERVIFPDFCINSTQKSYFKQYYDFKIIGVVKKGVSNTSYTIDKENDLIEFVASDILDDSAANFRYFNKNNYSSINGNKTLCFCSAEDILKDILEDKNFPEFYNKKIAVINTYNGLSTGTFAKKIMEAANHSGLSTKLYYGRLRDENDFKSIYFGTNKFLNLLNNIYVKLSGNIGHAHYFETKRLIKMLKDFNPDIIHLHNIAGNCLNYGLLFGYLKNKKVIITMHDCFWLTGRCSHFTYSQIACDKWKTGCKKCDHLDFYMRTYFVDKASKLYIEKRNFIDECKNLKLVCISNWQKKFFEQTNIPSNKIKLIGNGIDIGEFKRKISEDNIRRLIFVSSYLTKDKGIDEINLLADTLDKSKYKITVVGRLKKHIKLSQNINYLGALPNEKVIQEIAESDLFVYPTHADTLPSVLIESLLVGTPVITYDIGGCSDIVGSFGKCIKYGEFEEFVGAIQRIDLQKFDNKKISNESKKRFNLKEMQNNYLKLYSEVLTNE